MQGTDARSVPAFVLGSDRRLFRPGVTTQQFPGPALSPVTVVNLSPIEVKAAVDLATAAKLSRKVDFGLPPTADVPEFQITYKGVTNIVASFGVGEEGLPATQRAGRKKLRALVNFLSSRRGEKLYSPESLVVSVVRYDETNVDPTVKQTPKPWPGEAFDLREMGGCKVLVGAQAKAAAATLAQANALTPFTSSGYTYTVFARPLLLGDAGCGSSN
jgi:hypothetical protein